MSQELLSDTSPRITPIPLAERARDGSVVDRTVSPENGRIVDPASIPALLRDIDANISLENRLSGNQEGGGPLPDALADLMRSFARHVGYAGGRLRIDGLGVLVLQERLGDSGLRWCGAVGAVSAGAERRSRTRSQEEPAWRPLPICYAAHEIGELRLPWLDAAHWAQCTAFARRCGRLVKRHQVLRWSAERLGRPLQLAGDSEPLRRLEAFVEIAAGSELPVLLRGEFGTEKALVAASIHCVGSHPATPFVEVIGAHPEGTPARWFRQARGGTLFFNGIDELPLALQTGLSRYLRSRLDQWLVASAGALVRVIASTTADLGAAVAEGRFSRSLLAELDFLSTTIPPLRERMDDLEALVDSALARGGHARDPERTRVVAAACRDHAWPENVFELERVVARLAALTAGRPATLEDVVRHVPWRVAAPIEAASEAEPPAAAPSAGDASAGSPLDPLQHWVDCALALDPSRLTHLHPGLRKALMHLGHHYARPMSLHDLAASAHVSPSHLGFLLRDIAGTSFKPLLQAIRLDRAKALLRDDPHLRITEAALSVGFMDLSHFEKSFRRVVGRTPRQFRAGA